MDALLRSSAAILQIFAVITLGWLLAGRLGGLIGSPDKSFWKTLSRLVYTIGIPALVIDLFIDFKWDSSLNMFVFAAAIATCMAIVVTLIVVFITPMPDVASKTTAASVAYHPNSIFLGFPLIVALFGKDALPLAVLYTLVEFPISMIASIYILQRGNGANGKHKPHRIVLKNMLADPVIWSFIIGFALAQMSLNKTAIWREPLHLLGLIASPLALIIVGSRVEFSRIRKITQAVSLVTFLKLLVIPFVAWGLLLFLPIEHIQKAIIVILIGAPMAMSPIILVEQHGGRSDVVAGSISATTILSAFTLTALATLLV